MARGPKEAVFDCRIYASSVGLPTASCCFDQAENARSPSLCSPKGSSTGKGTLARERKCNGTYGQTVSFAEPHESGHHPHQSYDRSLGCIRLADSDLDCEHRDDRTEKQMTIPQLLAKVTNPDVPLGGGHVF